MMSLPKTMSGILIEETGGVEALQWKTDLPVPELKEGEILVRNEFVGVNYIDTYFRTGLYRAPLPLVTGKEAAGVIIALHPSVPSSDPTTPLKEGVRVAYVADHAYAEYTAVPATCASPIPEGLSTETAAASLLQGLTALTFVREAAGLARPRGTTHQLGVSEGPWALVHAAAGGAGSMLVQMLVVHGAKVIGTAGGKEKCEIARRNGAQWVVDSKAEDVVARVKEITGGRGVDVIFDGVGKATFEADLEMVARKGTVAVFGNASGPVPPVDVLRLGAKNIKLMRPVLFSYIAIKEERDAYTKELFELLLAGKVNVKIHHVYPLKEVGSAHTDLEGRKTTGKLLLKI
ncbi:NAD(P)-binding protein [Parathielavia appendiculata]|uniref:Probable quinone oxidoreductase n=1 Tax=Parathielavia appendiculata TaxID=2587402 RepID=A0AAN6U3P3_9PEZI|nr:NAD(P)-binding protein [Parathielavia appendiculata]